MARAAGVSPASRFEQAVDWEKLRDKRDDIMLCEISTNTLRCYSCYWSVFSEWCKANELQSLPAEAETLLHYIVWRLEQKIRFTTVRADLNAIRYFHLRASLESPITDDVRKLMKNARRKLHHRARGKRALETVQLRELSVTLDQDDAPPIATRDRAIILLGFATGWRGGELASLQYEDLHLDSVGRMVVQLGASKTDQTAKIGRQVSVPPGKGQSTCPIEAMSRWLELRGHWQGPLFCKIGRHQEITCDPISTGIVRDRLQMHLGKIGLTANQFGSHSLRVGMITSSVENGADALAIAQRTGHRYLGSVLRYVRPAKAMQYDPLAGVL